MNIIKKILSVVIVIVLLFTVAPIGGLADIKWLGFEVSAATHGDFEFYDGVIFSYEGDASDLSIPSEINGEKVCGIMHRVFENNKKLKSVIIPDGVTYIGNSAFLGCENLEKIILPDNKINIGISAFFNTAYYNDESNWENGVLYIGKHLIEANYTLSGDYEIKKDTLSIAEAPFHSCSNLTGITIPDGITEINDSMFAYCSNLKTVTIPDSITSIGDSSFMDCKSLESITIPDGVTSIYFGAFNGCSNLKSFAFPEGITSIAPNIFRGCESLTEIIVPKSITRISYSAFSGCKSLTDVYFTGDEATWKNVVIDEDNDDLLKAAIHYNYVIEKPSTTEPTTEPSTTHPTATKPSDNSSGSDSSSGNTNQQSNATKPAKVTLKSLKSAKKGRLVVTWNKVADANGYEVMYSTAKKFKKKATKTKVIKKGTKAKVTIKKLKSKKKYFVKVRAFKTVNGQKLYGKWSKVKNVKVK